MTISKSRVPQRISVGGAARALLWLSLPFGLALVPAHAQNRTGQVSTGTQADAGVTAGRTATVSGGAAVGQRETRPAAVIANPIGRIDNRVKNRVQNRLRNRIDRGYDPRANATSPFETADDQLRRTPRGRR